MRPQSRHRAGKRRRRLTLLADNGAPIPSARAAIDHDTANIAIDPPCRANADSGTAREPPHSIKRRGVIGIGLPDEPAGHLEDRLPLAWIEQAARWNRGL